MKRSIVAVLFLLSALAGLATGVFLPALAHTASKNPKTPLHCIATGAKQSCQPIKPVKKPPLHCGVAVAGQINTTTGNVTPSKSKQPCATPTPRYQHYTWSTNGKAHSPFMAVPAHWTLSYICDGGEGQLEVLSQQWLLERAPMTCDNIWHRQPMEDTGAAVQLWASRQADFLVA